MQTRRLGNSDLAVAPLMLGGNVFGWTADEATSFRILDEFVDAGFNFVDTADVYSRWVTGHSGGESESIIGRWWRQGGGRREKVLIATKVGLEMSAEKKGLSSAHIVNAVEDSLRRLQTDYIDLYQAHRDDSQTELGETLEAFGRLVNAGKIRYAGASNYTGERLREALSAAAELNCQAYVSLQPQYNLHDRIGYESELEAVCLENQLGVIPYYSLAAGFLTGKYKTPEQASSAARGYAVGKYFDARGERILAVLCEIAKGRAATPAQIALAWLMARPTITAPIASATSVEQLREILKSVEISLSSKEILKLDEASS